MVNKMNKGFTYIETLIALAVFSIALLPLFPIMAQAYRNHEYSREAYTARLHAQGILTVARDAVANKENAAERAEEYTDGLSNPPRGYGIWYGEYEYLSDGWIPPGGVGGFDNPEGELAGLPGEMIIVICLSDSVGNSTGNNGDGGNVYGKAAGVIR